MSEKLKMPFEVPKKAEVRESVSRSYWSISAERVASAPYKKAVEQFQRVANAEPVRRPSEQDPKKK